MARFIITGEYKDKATKAARKDLKALSAETSFYGKMAKKYWGIATAAASYYVQKGLRQSIAAAIDDERTQRQLAFTLDRVAGANTAAAIAAEANISAMSRQYGIADDTLRPALSRLLRLTGNLTQAYSGLDLALSLSVASGEDLDRTVSALGKAYSGNYKALKSLGFQIDDNLMKEKKTSEIIRRLRSQYGSFAKNELNTTENQYKRIKVAAGEAAETIGVSLVNAVNSFIGASGGVDGVSKTFETLAQDTADTIDGLAKLAIQAKLSGRGVKQSWVTLIPIVGAYLDQIRKNQAETRKLATITSLASKQIISAKNAEYLAEKKRKEEATGSLDLNKKTLEQLMAEEAARKAGFKITEDIDSIQTVAAAKRLEESRQYKASVIDAAQAQFDAIKRNYDLLNSTWQVQQSAFDVFLAYLKSKSVTIPVNFTGGALPTPGSTPSLAAALPEQAIPSFMGGVGSSAAAGDSLALGGQTINITVNAGAIGSEEFLVGAVGDALTKYTRYGNTTAPAGFI